METGSFSCINTRVSPRGLQLYTVCPDKRILGNSSPDSEHTTLATDGDNGNDVSGLLFENCPLGCREPLQTTEIVTPDGSLRLCPACGQLISSCSKQVYYDSLEASNRPEGTAPSLKDMRRFQQRTRRILRLTERFTGRSARDMALLDVGCSSGALLHVARDEGFGAVSGVEPGSRSAATASAAGQVVYLPYLL